MRHLKWYLLLALLLLASSAAVYFFQIREFHRTEDTLFYMIQDVAFVPVQVLMATVILNSLLARRERQAMLRKMNMAIGVFFSEVGTTLLQRFSACDKSFDQVRPLLLVRHEWRDRDFRRSARALANHNESDVQVSPADLAQLREFLLAKRPFLLSLLENANLLEHDTFTNLMWAVFHLTEELAFRENLNALTKTDLEHLAGDVRRAYAALMSEWIIYVRHLKVDYPYIFSLVIRTNPVDPTASVVVR